MASLIQNVYLSQFCALMATFLRWIFILLVVPIAALSRPPKPANVLYIVVDDLRPEMNLAYNQSHIITPNFDRLAQRGLTFSRAYCQVLQL